MLNAIRELLNKFRGSSLQRRDYTPEAGEHVENTDAMAAADLGDFDAGSMGDSGGGIPPGYVKSYDEGRPRK